MDQRRNKGSDRCLRNSSCNCVMFLVMSIETKNSKMKSTSNLLKHSSAPQKKEEGNYTIYETFLFIFLFSVFQIFFYIAQSAAHCCWSMFILWIPKTKNNLFWDCSPDLLNLSIMDTLRRVFAEICMSATLESHIVFSGGHALWKFPRHLFHSQISSGH